MKSARSSKLDELPRSGLIRNRRQVFDTRESRAERQERELGNEEAGWRGACCCCAWLVRRSRIATDDWRRTRLKVAVRGLFVEEERKKGGRQLVIARYRGRRQVRVARVSRLRKIEGVQSLGRQKEMKQVSTRVLLPPLTNTPLLKAARTSSETTNWTVTQQQDPGRQVLTG
jgi:hypothetical protein